MVWGGLGSLRRRDLCLNFYTYSTPSASVGVFTEVSPGSFALTPLAELLRTEATGSMRALAIMYAEEQFRAWGDLPHSVRTG
jgi:hypothetical protein